MLGVIMRLLTKKETKNIRLIGEEKENVFL